MRPLASIVSMFLDPELVHASKNNRILYLKTVPMIEVSESFVVGESPSEILEDMPREVETKKP
jgi:bacterioferritin (cytochrome b1)